MKATKTLYTKMIRYEVEPTSLRSLREQISGESDDSNMTPQEVPDIIIRESHMVTNGVDIFNDVDADDKGGVIGAIDTYATKYIHPHEGDGEAKLGTLLDSLEGKDYIQEFIRAALEGDYLKLDFLREESIQNLLDIDLREWFDRFIRNHKGPDVSLGDLDPSLRAIGVLSLLFDFNNGEEGVRLKARGHDFLHFVQTIGHALGFDQLPIQQLQVEHMVPIENGGLGEGGATPVENQTSSRPELSAEVTATSSSPLLGPDSSPQTPYSNEPPTTPLPERDLSLRPRIASTLLLGVILMIKVALRTT